MVKPLPAMEETRFDPLEDPLHLLWKIPWRRKWQPAPVLLPGKFQGRRNLVVYSLWDHKESDTTEQLHINKSMRYAPGY